VTTSGELTIGLLTAPGGVALLAALEGSVRDDVPWHDTPNDSRPNAVDAAVSAIATMSFGEMVRQAVFAGDRMAGPWNGEAPTRLATAYRLARERAPIAAAVAERFGDVLGAELDPAGQQWWASAAGERHHRPRHRDHHDVYCCGEFSEGGIWTVTAPPAAVHDELVGVWELEPEPVSRWLLPATPAARVYEIRDASDWAALVARHPRHTGSTHSGWELPGPNQHRREVAELIATSRGAAARVDVQVAMPDWVAVAAEYDAVHLSWAGMLTSEGHVTAVSGLGPNVVTMLRYWFSERTLWLNDVFGTPRPLPAPHLDPDRAGEGGISAADDLDRRALDHATLEARLGRIPFDAPDSPPG
jgi:hypothetical protein